MDHSDNDTSSIDQDSNPSPDFNDKSYQINKPMTRSRKAALNVNHSGSSKPKMNASNSPFSKRIRKKRIRENYDNQTNSNNNSNNGSFKSSNVNRQHTPTSCLSKIPPCIPVQIIEKNDNFIIVKFEWKNRILFGTLLDSSKFGWTKNSIFAESSMENNNKMASDDSDRNSPSSSNTNRTSTHSYNEEFICKHPKCGKKFKNNGGLINHQRLLNHKSTELKQDENNDLSNEDNPTITSIKDKDSASQYNVDMNYIKSNNTASVSNSQFISTQYSSMDPTISHKSFSNHSSENSLLDSKRINTPISFNNRTYGLLNYSPFTHSKSITSFHRHMSNSNQSFNQHNVNNQNASNSNNMNNSFASSSYNQPFSKQPYLMQSNNTCSASTSQNKTYSSYNDEMNNNNRTGYIPNISSHFNSSIDNGSYSSRTNNMTPNVNNNNSHHHSFNDRMFMSSFRLNNSISSSSSNNNYYANNNPYNFSNPNQLPAKNDKMMCSISNNYNNRELSNPSNRYSTFFPTQSNCKQSYSENKIFNTSSDSYANSMMYSGSYNNQIPKKGSYHHHQPLNYYSNPEQTYSNNSMNNNNNMNNLSSTSHEINDYGLYTKNSTSQTKVENSI